MAKVKFSRFNAAAHFVEGLAEWAADKGVEVYPLVIPAGAERYPLVSVITNQVRKVDATKDGGPDYLAVDVGVTIAVKETHKKSGQEWVAELADDVVELMDDTTGAHDGFAVRKCEWQSGAPDYDDARDCYVVELAFALEVETPEEIENENDN